MGEEILVKWWEWEVYRHWTRYPNAWTYRQPIENPRVIYSRELPCVKLGSIHKEMDDKGQLTYRIEGSKHTFPYLNAAAQALYARHRLQGLSTYRGSECLPTNEGGCR